MKKVLRNILVLVIVFAAAFFIARLNKSKDEAVIREQIILGTVVQIQIKNVDQQKADKVINEVFDEIRRIDNLFTTYDEESPIVKINTSGDSLVTGIDKEIYSLLGKCDSISSITGNAFDVSLHEIILLWGFETDKPAVPSEEKLKTALMNSGWDNVDLRKDTLIRSGKIKFNFGAIAKGYAVDRGIEVLKKNGITEGLVNAGGEVRTLGSGWKVGIQHPRKKGEYTASIKLNDFSVATSGDYEQFFENNGKRFHHIMDPSTGYPAGKCQSVTVLNKDNFTADALATGIFVMGPEKGLALIEQLPGTEVLIVDSDAKIHMSSGFNNYLLKVN